MFPVRGAGPDAIHNGTTRNGEGGAETRDDGKTFRAYGAGNSVVFRLDLAHQPAGWELAEVRSFAGHHDARAGQAYSVSVATATAPSELNRVGAVAVTCEGGASQTRIPVNARGIAAVRLDFADGPLGFNVYREICVLGRDTGVPLTLPNIGKYWSADSQTLEEGAAR